MPLPLAMMIPFMGIQSAVMAKQFGENFQYGKRRISAMDNDTFNKLTPKLMLSNANKELADMIPEMKESITQMTEFQEFLVREFLIMVDNIIKAGLGELLGLSPGAMDNIEKSIEHFLHGHIHFADPRQTPTPTGPDPIVPEPVGLLHLTLSQISNANDQVLLSWIRNIQDYDAQTQQWLINERQRRGQRLPPEPPSPPQQNTKLHPTFVGGLTETDLKTGGARTRMTRWGLQKWKGTHKFTYSTQTMQQFNWTGRWSQGPITRRISEATAVAKVNQIKRDTGSSYVIEFKRGVGALRWYLISDNF